MSDNAVFERIKDEISSNPVVLYMKGTPVFPQCGFSAMVVQVLSHLGVKCGLHSRCAAVKFIPSI